MAHSYPTSTGKAQQPDTPCQLTPFTSAYPVNIITPDGTPLYTLEARVVYSVTQQLRQEFGEILKLIPTLNSNATTHEVPGHLSAIVPDDEHPATTNRRRSRRNDHAQTESSSSRGSTRGSTRSSSIFINSNAGDPEVTRFTPSTDSEEGSVEEDLPRRRKRPFELPINHSSVGTMITFNQDMDEIQPRRKRPRTQSEQQRINDMRLRGACDECRSTKRQCKPEHPPPKTVPKTHKRGHPYSSHKLQDLLPSSSEQATTSQDVQVHPRLTPEMPPLHIGTNDRRASLPNLNLPKPDLHSFTGYRKAYGVHRSPPTGNPLADQVQASSTDFHQDQPSMSLPGQSYPSYPAPYLDVQQRRGAVSPQFFGTAWSAPYPPDPKVFHGHPVPPYIHGHVDNFGGHVTHSGFLTNFEPRHLERNLFGVSNNDWLRFNDPYHVQEMSPAYPDESYRDRLGISDSIHQAQEMMALPCTQGFGSVPRDNQRFSQARPQESENANSKACTGNSSAHGAVEQHDIPEIPPEESSTYRSPSPLQSSGHPASSQVFPTHGRVSSPENPDFDWVDALVSPT